MKNVFITKGGGGKSALRLLVGMVVLITLSVLFTRCDKNELDKTGSPHNADLPIKTRTLAAIGDRIYFATYDDFEDYYIDLDNIITNYNGDYFDSIVDLTSPVQTLNDFVMSDSSNSFGPIADPVMRGIVNTHNEFQIDDVIITLVNDAQWLVFDATNTTLQTTIRGLTKGSDLAFANIPSGATLANPRDIEQVIIKIWCGCRIAIEPHGCDSLRVFGHCNGFFGTNGGGFVDVFYTPEGGARTELFDGQVMNNFEFFINTQSFQEGSFSAEAIPFCQTASNVDTYFNFDPADFGDCDKENRRKDAEIDNGNERIWTRTAFIRSLLSDVHVAEAKSWTKNGNEWKPSRANLTVGVEANRKSLGCSLLGSKNDNENCNNCRHRITRVSWSNDCYHCDGDLVGEYRKVRSGITINTTQSVDFICCQ